MTDLTKEQARNLAVLRAAAEVRAGITVGRLAYHDGIPREAMRCESERIGWDDAESEAAAPVALKEERG